MTRDELVELVAGHVRDGAFLTGFARELDAVLAAERGRCAAVAQRVADQWEAGPSDGPGDERPYWVKWSALGIAREIRGLT